MIERRKFVRLKDSLKIGYRSINDDVVGRDSFSTDIGGGGISIPVANRVKPGTRLELEISLPKQDKPVVVTGEVVWLNTRDDVDFPFVIGVKFNNIDPFDRGKILKYITQKIRDGELVEIEWID